MALTFITSNIRFDNPEDGQNAWPARKHMLAELLISKTPDVIATQEGRQTQLYELKTLLSNHQISESHREWITERMYPTIFFNPDRLKIIKSGDIWLSLFPKQAGSSSFGSAFPRLCTWALFLDTKLERTFYFFNAHLDHLSETTRYEQAKVLVHEMKQENKLNLPFVLVGDFNTNPKSDIYSLITKDTFRLNDSFHATENKTTGTFHNFKGPSYHGERIDWQLFHEHFEVLSQEILTDSKDDKYPSDHYPVLTKSKFR